jgi:hypothetical protein
VKKIENDQENTKRSKKENNMGKIDSTWFVASGVQNGFQMFMQFFSKLLSS